VHPRERGRRLQEAARREPDPTDEPSSCDRHADAPSPSGDLPRRTLSARRAGTRAGRLLFASTFGARARAMSTVGDRPRRTNPSASARARPTARPPSRRWQVHRLHSSGHAARPDHTNVFVARWPAPGVTRGATGRHLMVTPRGWPTTRARARPRSKGSRSRRVPGAKLSGVRSDCRRRGVRQAFDVATKVSGQPRSSRRRPVAPRRGALVLRVDAWRDRSSSSGQTRLRARRREGKVVVVRSAAARGTPRGSPTTAARGFIAVAEGPSGARARQRGVDPGGRRIEPRGVRFLSLSRGVHPLARLAVTRRPRWRRLQRRRAVEGVGADARSSRVSSSEPLHSIARRARRDDNASGTAALLQVRALSREEARLRASRPRGILRRGAGAAGAVAFVRKPRAPGDEGHPRHDRSRHGRTDRDDTLQVFGADTAPMDGAALGRMQRAASTASPDGGASAAPTAPFFERHPAIHFFGRARHRHKPSDTPDKLNATMAQVARIASTSPGTSRARRRLEFQRNARRPRRDPAARASLGTIPDPLPPNGQKACSSRRTPRRPRCGGSVGALLDALASLVGGMDDVKS